jgi:hypothetical protein
MVSSSLFNRILQIHIVASIVLFCFIDNNIQNGARIMVLAAHLFLFALELTFFALESFGFQMGQPHFMRDLILLVLAIPGSFILFVPVSQFSYDTP